MGTAKRTWPRSRPAAEHRSAGAADVYSLGAAVVFSWLTEGCRLPGDGARLRGSDGQWWSRGRAARLCRLGVLPRAPLHAIYSKAMARGPAGRR